MKYEAQPIIQAGRAKARPLIQTLGLNLKLRYFRLVLYIAIILLGVGLFIKGIDEYKLDKEFKTNGVKTEATLTGYQYWENYRHREKGERPVFSYASSKGITHKYIAYEYLATTELNKKSLATQKIFITYLPRNEEIARIDLWYGNKEYTGIFWGAVFVILGLLVLVQQLNLTHHSSGTPNGAP